MDHRQFGKIDQRKRQNKHSRDSGPGERDDGRTDGNRSMGSKCQRKSVPIYSTRFVLFWGRTYLAIGGGGRRRRRRTMTTSYCYGFFLLFFCLLKSSCGLFCACVRFFLSFSGCFFLLCPSRKRHL